MMGSSRLEIVRELARRIDEMEVSERSHGRSALTLDLPGLEQLTGSLPAGSMIELLSKAAGAGAWTLGLLLARQACERGCGSDSRPLVVVDVGRCFYLPAAVKLGVELARTIVIRPRTWKDAFVAIDQSLRCPAVGAVIGRCDLLRTADCRRLQLAAEAGGGLGLLLRRADALRMPSFAALRLQVNPYPRGQGSGVRGQQRAVGNSLTPDPWPLTPARRRIQVDVVRYRGGKEGQSVVLEIDDETGHVRLSTPVADPAAAARRARPTG
jgi:protein ImuA